MIISTEYGICKNIDLEHLKLYANNKYTFVDNYNIYDIHNYLILYFEVWPEEYCNNDEDPFHFFVEEYDIDGHIYFHKVDLKIDEINYIKRLYNEYIK